MQIPSFIRGFKHFMSRRGIPDVVVSNKLKTFQSVEVKRFMLQHQIIQKFISLASLGVEGRYYERLVRSEKTSWKKVFEKSFLFYDELETLLCDVEAVVNS